MTYDEELSVSDLGQINIDQFPKWAPKAKASTDFWKHAPPSNFLDVNSPKSLFLGFRLIQTGYWPVPCFLDEAGEHV